MHYETKETKADILKNGQVTDTEYNSGLIVSTRDYNEICTFGMRKTGDDLIDAYQKGTAWLTQKFIKRQLLQWDLVYL